MTTDDQDTVQDTPDQPEPAAGPAPAADAAIDDVQALRDRVEQLERDLAAERERATDYMQKWQRAQADHANFRRRAQQDQEQFTAIAAAQTMALVLPALDSLERAFKVLPESLHQLTWIDGIALVELQLRRALEAQGLVPFEPQPGDSVDFTRHQAIAEVPSAEHPEGAVVEVVQRGYELNGRTLRPALVRVARKPETTSPTTPPDGPTSGSSPPETESTENAGGP